MRIVTYLLLLVASSVVQVVAQGIYVPLGSPSMHMLDRFEIKQGRLATPYEFSTSAKAYKRESIAHFADSFETRISNLSVQDKFNLTYLQRDNFEQSNTPNPRKKGLWRTSLFKEQAALWHVKIPEFSWTINPVAYQRLAFDQSLNDFTFVNTRGLEMRGTLSKRIGFYTLLADEVQLLNPWDRSYYQEFDVLPSQSWVHREKYPTLGYWLASGYLNFTVNKYFDFQFGHGRNFIGNGYRSMMLADGAPDNLYLRMNTRIWRIQYTNIWGELYDYVPFDFNRKPNRRNYYATTHMGINITSKLNIGAFQTIVFQRDSGHSIKGYDPQYLNPIIFYLPIENGMNSPDKVILGTDFKYNFAKHFSLYGQAMLSELVVEELFANNGWWGNKVALQLGIKYIDVAGIDNLDLQVEMNEASPYMYTSFEPRNAWQSYRQNMAHPTGANFREWLTIVRYQPSPKWFIMASGFYNMYGNDTNGSNWGKNIGLSYYSLERLYGNYIGQGVTTRSYILDISTSYMVWHNVFIDLQLAYRKLSSKLGIFDAETVNIGVGLRWNMRLRNCNY